MCGFAGTKTIPYFFVNLFAQSFAQLIAAPYLCCMEIKFTHTVYLASPLMHPYAQEFTYDCVGVFEPQYEDCGSNCDVYTGDKFYLLEISLNGVALPAHGKGDDWLRFVADLEASARAQFESEAEGLEYLRITIHEAIEIA